MKHLQNHPFLTFFVLVVIVFYIYIGIFGLVGLVFQVIPGALVLAVILYLTRRDKTQSFGHAFTRAFLSLIAVFGVMVTLLWIFIAYNHLRPAPLTDITLSNGSGTIVFMSMSHIATEEFYSQKHQKLLSLSQSGYTIIVEGVKPGTEENRKKFDNYMGFQFTESLYSVVAGLGGLVSQDNDSLYAGIATGSLLSLDLSIDDIVPLIESKSSLPIVSGEVPPLDLEQDIQELQGTMSRGEAHFTRLLFRSLLSSLIRDTESLEAGIMDGDRRALFQVILHERNTPIIRYIEDHPGANMVIVYGALHFNDIYEQIQRLSPPWTIRQIDSYYPYK